MTAYEKLRLMNSGKTFLATESMNFYVVTGELIRLIDEMKVLLEHTEHYFYGDNSELGTRIEKFLIKEFS